MLGDMDINAGKVLEGVPVEEVGREILKRSCPWRAGKTKSEPNGVGEEELPHGASGRTL